MDKKDVEVNCSDGILTIVGERKNKMNNNDKFYVWQESQHGTFKRFFELSNTIQEDKIKASFKNGILTLIVPKAEEVKSDIKNLYDITVKLIDSNRKAKDETKKTMTAVNVIKDIVIKLFKQGEK